jgi:hypothetical protein
MPNSYSFMEPNPRERIMPNWKLEGSSVVWDENAPDPVDDTFDPSANSVADVKAYVEANPDERDTVLAAEQAGKGRVTLIDWLSADGS